jgi:peptidoglycan hydrolase CwlO-like protein
MKKVLLVFLIVLFFAPRGAWAQTITTSATGKSHQLICNEKVTDLTKQLSPLQKQRSALWVERKMTGTSGGDMARYKLSQLDDEITQVQKTIDDVSSKINTEKKRCDGLAFSPSTNPPAPIAIPEKPKRNSRKP